MNTRKILTIGGLVLAGLAAALLVSCTPVDLASGFSYQGVLTDGGGNPVPDGNYQVAFRLYNAASAGTMVYVVTQTVTTRNGIFSTVLQPPIEVMDDPLWVDLTVQGEHLPTRQRLWGAPYAMSLVPGSTIDGYIWKTSPVSATLNIQNAGDGIGLGVLQSNADGDAAIVAVNTNAGDDVPTLKLSNIASDGRLIEAWQGDDATNPWADRILRLDGSTENMYLDGNYNTGGGDYADLLPSAENVEPGDVLVIGSDGQMARSTTANATNVAGIYSTFPGFVGGNVSESITDGDPDAPMLLATLPELMTDVELERVPVALAGVVPCKVSTENGPIRPGDLLTTSSTPGHAMKADPIEVGGVTFYRPGTILGKAMEPLESGTGVILVLVSLQ